MALLAQGQCSLMLRNDNETKVAIRWIRGQERDERYATIQFMEGVIEKESSIPLTCRVVKIETYGVLKELFEKLYSRLKRDAVTLPQQFFKRGLIHFSSNESSYLCYEHYEKNFMQYMAEDHTITQVKKVIRGFMEALCYLHDNGITHGYIHYTNLVVSNGNGYIAGGIGCRVSNLDDKGKQFNEKDDLKFDLLRLQQSISHCYTHNFKQVRGELQELLKFIQQNQTRFTLLSHPFLLTPRLKKEYCIKLVAMMDALDDLEQCNKITQSFDNHQNTSLQKFGINPNWQEEVASIGGKLHEVYFHQLVGNDPNPGRYDPRLSQFLRFSRNFWVHLELKMTMSEEEHYEEMEEHLNRVWPNALCHVHRVIFEKRTIFGKILS